MISADLYQEIICLLDTANSAANSAMQEIIQMIATVQAENLSTAAMQSFLTPLRELQNRLALYAQGTNEQNTFFLALQRYVQINYGSVSQFIIDNNLVIPAALATLSQTLGYPIPTQHIAPCSQS